MRPRHATVLAALSTALCLHPWAIRAAAPPEGSKSAAAGTASQLRALKAQIEHITREVGADAVRRDRLSADLRSAELSVGQARDALARIDQAYGERSLRRAQLAAESARQQRALDGQRAALAGQMRAAYLIGGEPPLRQLLDQQSPEQAGRLIAYYSYLGQARARVIAATTQSVQSLRALDAQLAQEQDALAQLRQARSGDLSLLQHARDARATALAGIVAQQRTREASLEHLRGQQADLERLLRELNRSLRSSTPPDTGTAFGRLTGRLSWPVSGHLTAQFGETRAAGVKWDGVVIATERGTPVRAICAGRVVYSDWLPGLGLLMIIDHGQGYLSLYAHNERLLKNVGDSVAAGETIAAAGDTGGRATPELYFEIRREGRPVDPRPWFRERRPPP